MEELLIEFVNTFDLSLKQLHREVGDVTGFSKLTIHQLQYIDAIYTLGEPTITRIADKLMITKASVTTGINKLNQMGYLIKTQSSADKRVIHVSLTQTGRQIIDAKYQALKEYGELITNALSENEVKQFKATLMKIVNLFQRVR